MSEPLEQQSIGSFLDALASKSSTPGGGSVAALTGAMGAGLVSMVCALTIGKKQYADFEQEAQAIQQQAEELRLTLQQLAQADIEIFGRLSAAYKLPRTTDADAASRQAAIQAVTRQAAEVPLRTARATAALLPLCTPLVRRCNRLVVSDVGVAVELIRAAIQSSLINTEINLTALEDRMYVRETRAQLEDLTIGLNEEVAGVLTIMQERMHS